MAKNNLGKNIVVLSSAILLLIVGAGLIGNIEKKFDDMPGINSVLNGTSSEDNRQEENSSDNIDDSSSEDDLTSEDTNSSENGDTSSEEEFVSQHHFTIVGSMNEWDVTNNDYVFTTTNDITFTLNADLEYLSEWKIVNNNAWDWQYGPTNLTEYSKNFGQDSNGNIQMVVSGNYDITLNIESHTIELTHIRSLEETSTSTISILSLVDELLMTIDISDGMTWEDLDNKLGSSYLTDINGSTEYEFVIDETGVGLGSVQGDMPDDMYEPYCFYIRTLNDDGTSTLVKATDTISSNLTYKIFTSPTGE